MAVPASGAISLAKIRDELENNNYNNSLYGYTSAATSLASASNGTYGTINTNNASADRPDGSTPHAMSEFYSYDHDKAAAFTWNSTLGEVYGPTLRMIEDAEDRDGSTSYAGARIRVNWNSNGTHTTQFQDYSNETAGSSFSSGGSMSPTGTISSLEARIVFKDANIDFSGGDSNDSVVVRLKPGGSISTTAVTVRTGSNGDATDLDYATSWYTITPAQFGGNGANTQDFEIEARASSTSQSSFDSTRLFTSTTGLGNDHIGVEFRANGSSGPTIRVRNSLSANVDLEAASMEVPEFTCIMPDMIVKEQTKGYIRIGDVAVGDRILAKGDLNDSTVASTYAEVTEARTHTRSGYWNIEGLHITNDHPVWLTDEKGSAWVKVEDMRAGITRNYVAGTVDPVYLGTTPGHYYVYPVDKSQKFTVSGNYAPTTE